MNLNGNMNLNGKWKLYYAPQGERKISAVAELENSGIPFLDATVPGNVELDLSAAGILPEDLFKGMNILKAEKYENYEWWYEKSRIRKIFVAGPSKKGNGHCR